MFQAIFARKNQTHDTILVIATKDVIVHIFAEPRVSELSSNKINEKLLNTDAFFHAFSESVAD
jgi:hypothetical protein